MSTTIIDKRALTQKLISQLSLPDDEKTFRKQHSTIWMNPQKGRKNSLRLTEAGYKILKDRIQLKSYDVSFPEETEWNSKLILELDKFLESPYFLDRHHISVFREKTAVELVLFGGDLQKYTRAKVQSQKNNKDPT